MAQDDKKQPEISHRRTPDPAGSLSTSISHV